MDGLDLQNIIPILQSLAAEWGLKVLGALAVIVVGRVIAGWFRGGVKKGLHRADFDPTLVPFLANLVFIGINEQADNNARFL